MRCAGTVRVLLLVALLPPLPGQMRTYLKMEIDPGTRIVRLSGEVPISRGVPTVEHFQQFTQEFRQRIRTSVDRMVPIGEGQPSAFAELFYVNEDGSLAGRRTFQEVFRDSLGVFVAESFYQYPGYPGLGYGVGLIGFSLRAENSSIRREVPKIIDQLPLSATPLTSITVIRISKLQGIDLAAVATYSDQGELFSVSVDPLKPGDHVPQPTKRQTVNEVIQESIHQFGFPLTFTVDGFQKQPIPLYQRSDSPCPLTVVSFHYARNRWVQQYVFHDASGTPSKYDMRFLEFRNTPQDDDLRFFDQALKWTPAGDQRMYFPKRQN
jgi:hypothetical protein